MMGSSRGRCLYNSVQSVVMPDGKNRDLRIDITETGKPNAKVEVRITDDADPSLLYVLHVSEMDFNMIKTQQGLLVDFTNFPVHLVKLVEQCLNSVKGFLLMLEENGLETYLKVVQPIDLKNLCYIALRVTRGSDTEIMRHMHDQIIQMKTNMSSKDEECHRLQTHISQLQQDLSLREQKAQEQIQHWEEERRKYRSQTSEETDALRQQLLQERKRDLDAAAYQRETLNTKIEDLSKEVAKYKGKHWQVCEKYEQAQQAIRELSGKIASFEERHITMSRELADLRRRNAELETDYRKKEQEAGHGHSRAEALDKEVARLRSRLNRQEDQMREADAEQVRLKSALSRLQETTEARSDLVLQLNSDLTKANLIIKERQKEVDRLVSEAQRLANSNQEKETVITNLQLELKLVRANADRFEAHIKSMEVAEKKLRAELAEAKENIATKDEQHKKCGDVISYLHRSLNRIQLDPSPSSTALGASVLHSSAPPAPILYTLGSSLNRAGATAGVNGGLHMSGPQIQTMPAGPAVGGRPFSSTPLVASAASGGFMGTRRSFPGAMSQPRVQVQGKLTTETPARPVVDRVTLSQTQAKGAQEPNGRPQKDLITRQQARSQSLSKPDSKEQTQPAAAGNGSSSGTLKAKKVDKTVQPPVADKENKEWAFKPSAYFQPNKIRTEF